MKRSLLLLLILLLPVAAGWTQPKDFTQFPTEAKKWLKDNAGKYRIQRFVRASDKTGVEPEPE